MQRHRSVCSGFANEVPACPLCFHCGIRPDESLVVFSIFTPGAAAGGGLTSLALPFGIFPFRPDPFGIFAFHATWHAMLMGWLVG
jgi:hypothetical protein